MQCVQWNLSIKGNLNKETSLMMALSAVPNTYIYKSTSEFMQDSQLGPSGVLYVFTTIYFALQCIYVQFMQL